MRRVSLSSLVLFIVLPFLALSISLQTNDGTESLLEGKPSIDIYPEYLPKILTGEEYSMPFMVKVSMNNFEEGKYDIKVCIASDPSKSSAATQTWNGSKWLYSGWYVFHDVVFANGNWSGWISLIFKQSYAEYKRLMDQSSAYIILKVRNENNEVVATHRKVKLLDMDDSTKNGTFGGSIVGLFGQNKYAGKIVVVRNKDGNITGIYSIEDNSIDEGYPRRNGYYKLSSPVGTNYTLDVVDRNFSFLFRIKNITVRQGIYDFDLDYSNGTLYIQNTGDFYDTIVLNSSDNDIELLPYEVSLNPGEVCKVEIKYNLTEPREVMIEGVSKSDISICRNLSIKLVPTGSDLSVEWVKILNEGGKRIDRCVAGEILTVKAMVKNRGTEITNESTVSFYYDIEDEKHLIGKRIYPSIENYAKYPSIKLDTSMLSEGYHSIIVCVNCNCDEFNKSNNRYVLQLFVEKDILQEERLLITEVYYFTNPNMENEYVVISNLMDHEIELSDFYITDQPMKRYDLQNKILFPHGTKISPNSSIVLTFNATAYYREVGKFSDFEYGMNSTDVVPDIPMRGFIRLSNDGDVVVLKSKYNSTIDVVAYGNVEYHGEGWIGKAIPGVKQGEILKRRIGVELPIDTDTAEDWRLNRVYRIGQSDFRVRKFDLKAEICALVSPDCSFDVLCKKLELADDEILLNVYELTNEYLTEILEGLLERGVKIGILVEGNPVGGMKDEEIYLLNRLSSKGADVYLMNGACKLRYGFDHAKYAIIDNETLIIGSANWDEVGFPLYPCHGNREWVIIVKNQTVAGYFKKVFNEDCNVILPDVIQFEEIPVSIEKQNEKLYTTGYKNVFSPLNITANMSLIPVLSPDTSREIITELIDSAEHTIYIEQLYIHADWESSIEDIIRSLINASNRGVKIKVIMNYNPNYDNRDIDYASRFLKAHGIEVRFLYGWFVNVHTKGMIVDNRTVLISSINWNEQSIDRNREAGIVIENGDISRYYAKIFLYDWELCEKSTTKREDYKNHIFIFTVFAAVFVLILLDWRKT